MRREEIIAKGAYTAPQFSELISVKQFIMLRRQGAKQLLLRLHNDRAEQADTVSFRVKQYDVKGTLLGTETVVERNLKAKPGEDFTPSRPIPLHAACVDFTVEMIYAEYGDYTYRLHGDQLAVTYENRSDLPPFNKRAITRQMHGKSSQVSVRTLSAPKILVASMAIILLIIGAFAFVQLRNFMATEEFFTLDNIEYRFESDNHVDGPISIIGYTGKAGNIIIPAVIEGYPVVGIDDNAFKGKMLKSVTIKGDLKIGQSAFADCSMMDTVSIPLVTDLGKGAFADCRNLRNLTLCDELTAIPDSAFEGCTALTEVSLPSGLISLGGKAFKGCEKLTEIRLPDTLSQVGKDALTDCTSLSKLTAPYAGVSVYGDDTIGYLFGGNNRIPASLTHIVITKATSVGASAFQGCGNAVSIQLPDTVTVIGKNAFRNCSKLTELHLPDSVISIGESAFHGCASLAEITIPDGVSIISEMAFAECTSLKSISLPRELKTIKSLAFENCKSLTHLDVPTSVTSIQSNALAGCSALEDLIIPFMGETAESPAPLTHLFGDTTHGLKRLTVKNVGEIVEGAFAGFDRLNTVSLYGTADFVGARAFEDCAALHTVLLPDSVTDIGEFAFAGCASLSAVDLPSELTTIREGVFLGCSSLWDVDVPDGVQSVETRAFAGCASLKDVSWLNSVERMGEYVFEGCTSLEWAALPAEMTKVENGTFSGCTSLREVTISPSTTVIGERAFYDCSKLAIAPLSGLTQEIMPEAFANCASLTSITLPVTVTKLGNWAFAGCSSITELTVPDGVAEIGSNLIDGCSKLETLTIPYIGPSRKDVDRLTYLASPLPSRLQYVRVTNAQALAEQAFAGGSNLTTILLPTGLLSIGSEAFQDCTSLTSLDIPETVTRIGERAFSGCRSLKEIVVPNSVTTLQYGMLERCNALKSIAVPFIGENRDNPQPLGFLFADQGIPSSLSSVTLTNASILAAHAFDGCDRLTSVTLDCDLLDISEGAFSNCTGLTTLSLPDTLTAIGERAFCNCSSLTELSLPEAVETVGAYAFEDCSRLDTVAIPASVQHIGIGVFRNCSSIRELEIPFVGSTPDDEHVLDAMFDGWRNSVPSTLKKVTLTASTTIKSHAFAGHENIQEIILDCDVTTIEGYAFSGCTSLTEFEIPDTVVSIGESAFNECISITSLSVPVSVTHIGNNAFYNCHSLEELEIPFVGNSREDSSTFINLFGGWYDSIPQTLKTVTVTDSSTVKDNAFYGCYYIADIIYDCPITAVGNGAFYMCNSLTGFDLPDTVTRIGDSAFSQCSLLEELSLPDGLEQIGAYAFEYCGSLRSLSIPTSVSYIGYAAMNGCSSLEELELPFIGSTPTDSNSLSSMLGGSWNAPRSLKKVTVTGSTVIPGYAFSDMQYLEEIIYTQDVTSIDYESFRNCRNLETLEIGESLQSIGSYAFSGCYSLKSFTIPETCTSMGYYVFTNTYALYEVYNKSNLIFEVWDDKGVRSNCLIYRDNDDEVVKVTVDDFVLLLADDGEWYVIDYVGDETSLSFPSEFTYNGEIIDHYRIAQLAFLDWEDVECVIIPEAVDEIRFDAFYGCNNLREVYDLSDLIITRGAYDHGYVAYNAYIVHTSMDEEPLSTVRLGDFEFVKSEDNWFLVGYLGNGGDVVLDSFMYEGREIPAYEVLRGAFEQRYDITSLVITNAVKYIAPHAFQNMGALQRVVFEENNALTDIPEYTFAWCYDLKQVTLHSSLTEIANDAFWDCQSLREVYNLSDLDLTLGSHDHGCVALYAYVIHDSLSDPALTQVQIGDFVFLNSGDLWLLESYSGSSSRVVLGAFTYNGKTIDTYSILKYAFAWNSYIEEVEIGNEVKSMEREAFYNCTNLRSVSFEHNTSITTLRPSTFAYNYSLDQVILPASLTSIEDGAFWNCMNLLEVYNLSSLPLTCGDSGYGHVAYYAKVIHTSMDEPGLGVENVSCNGYTYKFICEDGEWRLFYRIQHGNYDWRFVLPELVIDGEVTPYRVDIDVSGHSMLVIPASVTYVNLNNFGGSDICYGGTQAEFAALSEGFNVSRYNVRYYADCVHGENQWSYDADGSIITSMNLSSYILQEGSCSVSRIDRFTCHRCQKTWDQEVNIWASHDLDENLVCRVCHGQFTTYPLSDVWGITNDGRYPFEYTEDGAIVSTNKDDGSTATIQLKALKNMVFSYRYYVSTEDGCDVLIIRHNGATITRASGTANHDDLGNTLNVTAGDVITITYTKDGSVSNGEDLVKVMNLIYLVKEAGDDHVES